MKPHLLCQHPGAYCTRRWMRTVDGVRVCQWHPDETPPPQATGDPRSSGRPKKRAAAA